jgi:hypothetical protein
MRLTSKVQCTVIILSIIVEGSFLSLSSLENNAFVFSKYQQRAINVINDMHLMDAEMCANKLESNKRRQA